MRALALRAMRGKTKKFRLPSLGMGPQVVALLLVLGLLGAMAIEPTRQLIEQRERMEGMSSDLEQVQRSNRKLEDRIERLKDPDFLEQRARDIGLVRAGETAYVVMPPSRGSGDRKKPKQAAPEPTPAAPGFLEGFLSFIGLR